MKKQKTALNIFFVALAVQWVIMSNRGTHNTEYFVLVICPKDFCRMQFWKFAGLGALWENKSGGSEKKHWALNGTLLPPILA